MIIDTHHHQILSASDEKIRSILADSIRFSKIAFKRVDVEHLFLKAKETWLDPDGEKLLGWMDKSIPDLSIHPRSFSPSGSNQVSLAF